MVSTLDHIVANMSSLAPGSELDINNTTMRFALDITGARSNGWTAAVHAGVP